jgi:hypothetical protein
VWHNQQLGARFAEVLSHRLCNTTVQAYGSKLRKFDAFAASLGVPAVPASEVLVYEYLAYLSTEGQVHPKHFAQYLAVVNSMHRDLGLPTPWMESGLCRVFQQSAQKLVTAGATTRPVRQPLLAEQVVRFVAAGLTSADAAAVRAATALPVFGGGALGRGLAVVGVLVAASGAPGSVCSIWFGSCWSVA